MFTIALMLIAADPAKPIPPLRETTKAEIQRKLDLELIDGASARYLWPKRTDSSAYCGFVNAKNSLGGYVGWKLFTALLIDSPTKGQVLMGVSLPGQDKFCLENGYPIDPTDID